MTDRVVLLLMRGLWLLLLALTAVWLYGDPGAAPLAFCAWAGGVLTAVLAPRYTRRT